MDYNYLSFSILYHFSLQPHAFQKPPSLPFKEGPEEDFPFVGGASGM